MSREASLQELLTSSFESQMNNVYTSIPCIVVGVRDSLNGQMVDIQPTVNQKLVSGITKERPPILGVPVQFQVSNLSGMTFPIKTGDTGLAVFSMRNLDSWKGSNGRPTTPANGAKMDKGDAVFIPGIQPPGMAVNNPAKHVFPHSTEDVVVFHNLGTAQETEIRVLAGGGIVINTNQDVTTNCKNMIANVEQTAIINTNDLVIDAANSIDMTTTTMTVAATNTTWIGNINQTGNYTITGTLLFNGINFNTHRHTGVQTGPSTSGGPTN